MANLTTEENCIRIDDVLLPKNSKQVTKLKDGVRLSGNGATIIIEVANSTIDNEPVTDVDQLFDFFKENGFSSGGGNETLGVASITGDLVDNTDPFNPVIDASSKVDKEEGFKLISNEELEKLEGIESEATKNDTDANLKDRENHTGEQSIDTITDLQNQLTDLSNRIQALEEQE